jgi:hypothetical protein
MKQSSVILRCHEDDVSNIMELDAGDLCHVFENIAEEPSGRGLSHSLVAEQECIVCQIPGPTPEILATITACSHSNDINQSSKYLPILNTTDSLANTTSSNILPHMNLTLAEQKFLDLPTFNAHIGSFPDPICNNLFPKKSHFTTHV